MQSIEIQAKTIDEAVEQGLEKLGACYADVEVEVISNGGMFKKAKVKLTLKESAKKPEPVAEKKEIPAPVVGAAPCRPCDKPAREEKSEEKKEEKSSKERVGAVNNRPVKQTSSSAVLDCDPDTSPKLIAATKFVQGLLEGLGNTSTVTPKIEERTYQININGDDVGRLIGKGGEALNALQTLVSTIAIAHANGDNKRVYVNVENYKERREETLKTLARRKAEYVASSGKTVRLDPMNPRDRAIVHTALQDVAGIRTYSTGEGDKRRLCIAPEKKDGDAAE